MTRKIKLFLFIGLLGVYFIAPILAGVFEIGDKMGPRIYPTNFHESLYCLGWELSTHKESKPHVGYWFKKELRPMFYGLHSKNYDLPVPQIGAGNRTSG